MKEQSDTAASQAAEGSKTVAVQYGSLQTAKGAAQALREGLEKLTPLERTVARQQIAAVTRLVSAVEAL
ncbi:hypothetical protein [Burkholderia gladioli]|uniref:hypothetical protein n=1 Tax=Burkholderia gladioli TaxID=28095 RepID=UPI001641F31E|nr:hypothetical protein [Burkholderia gladioli]MBU9320389.1 hypothetical protein [Burkholderia gladioli]